MNRKQLLIIGLIGLGLILAVVFTVLNSREPSDPNRENYTILLTDLETIKAVGAMGKKQASSATLRNLASTIETTATSDAQALNQYLAGRYIETPIEVVSDEEIVSVVEGTTNTSFDGVFLEAADLLLSDSITTVSSLQQTVTDEDAKGILTDITANQEVQLQRIKNIIARQ